jgi:hypothetical protein
VTKERVFPRHAEFLRLIHGGSAAGFDPEYLSIIDIIVGYHPDNLAVMTRHLTTGSDNARDAVREYLLKVISTLQLAHDEAENQLMGEDMTLEEYEDDRDERWNWAVAEHEHPVLQNGVRRVWHTAEVLEEIGLPLDVNHVYRRASNVLPFGIASTAESLNGSSSDQYWRGVAAASITATMGMVNIRQEAGDVHSFIAWAGAQRDIGRGIRTAHERGTLKVETLQGLLAEQEGKTALAAGVL